MPTNKTEGAQLFPPGQRIRVIEGECAGRVGVVTHVPTQAFRDHRRVEFDPRPRERTRKTAFLPVVQLAPEAP